MRGTFVEIELDLEHLDDLEQITVYDASGTHYDVDFYRDGLLAEENDKLRKLASGMYGLLDAYDRIMGNHDACETPRPLIFGDDRSFRDVMRECGIMEG